MHLLLLQPMVTPMSNTPKRFLILLVLCATALVGWPQDAVGQATPMSSDFEPAALSLHAHLRNELQSDQSWRQQAALQDIVLIAHQCAGPCSVRLKSRDGASLRVEHDLGLQSVLDLSTLAPDVLDVYRSSTDEAIQVMSLSAILRIGHEPTIEALVAIAGDQSSKIERMTHRGVWSYFTEKYPEIQKNSPRPLLTLDEVARARAERERDLRRARKNASSNRSG